MYVDTIWHSLVLLRLHISWPFNDYNDEVNNHYIPPESIREVHSFTKLPVSDLIVFTAFTKSSLILLCESMVQSLTESHKLTNH